MEGRRVLLFDDLFRSGATMNAFVVGGAADKRTLVFRDAQHEYTFGEK